jgi:hypothetical protein
LERPAAESGSRPLKKGATLLLSTLVVVIAAPARAMDIAANVGAIEVLEVPGPKHLGVYPYVGVSLAFNHDKFLLIPSLSVEFSPEFGHWGFVASCLVDFPLTDAFGVDAFLTLIHDQPGLHFRESAFFLELGAGVTFLLGKLLISPNIGVGRGLNVEGWSVIPGVNFAYIFASTP